MEDYVQHSLIVLVGGVIVFLIARLSRKNWIKQYGETSTKEIIRFWLCLLVSYFLLSLLVYFNPFIFIIFIALLVLLSQIGFGRFHIFSERPGLVKDVFYGGTISAIFAAITGFFIHAS